MIVVKTASNALLEQAFELRRKVFVKEQNVPEEAEFDWLDKSAEHLVAVDGGIVVGTCRLVVDRSQMVLQRVAVDPEHRGRGIGTMIVAEAEQRGRAAGVERIDMHAQLHAIGIYERAGFVAQGEPFDEDGIEHIAMSLQLTSL
jgi:predicted GNAT family N-acyltransferase